jgi:hypothetical protein
MSVMPISGNYELLTSTPLLQVREFSIGTHFLGPPILADLASVL